MLVTWNNDHAPSFDIVEGARRLVVQAITCLKAEPVPCVVELTAEEENELEMLACWN